MKILILADTECRYFWDHYKPGYLKDYDLIVSCGDLKPEYLSFLVTMGRAPVVYVHGNHDGYYAQRPPEGCLCIEDTVFRYGDLRLLGLGGSYRYSRGAHQYTEKQMRARIRKLRFRLWLHKGVDIIVTHAPVRDYGDDQDLPHRGFEAFWKLLEKYEPKYLFHGHVHMNYGHDRVRIHRYGETELINGYERYVVDLPGYDRYGKKTDGL
ncbi:MAG: metallophosphoesterase [Oscillospiraceae bacterium]|nr:metallophosphoesterase [Oscillospiraceae bacterium]